MAESILRRFLEHPHRQWIVIILTISTALVVIWPLADDYLAHRGRSRELERSLAEAQAAVAQRGMYEQRLEQTQEELKGLEARSLPEQRMFEFRGDVAEIARSTGCQVQQMRLGNADLRRWRMHDDPLEAAKQGKLTPFELRTQQFSLSVLGPLAAIKAFLGQLEQDGKLMHTQSLAIRPDSSDPRMVELDLQLQLFDLQSSPAEKKK